jgi:hypothetical protein
MQGMNSENLDHEDTIENTWLKIFKTREQLRLQFASIIQK